MEKGEFYRSIRVHAGSEATNILLIETDQQSAKNEPVLNPIRTALGPDVADQISDMLDASFAAGFIRGLERGHTLQQGESDEGYV
jgi:hypothetical protein